jgi:hypothetical protein
MGTLRDKFISTVASFCGELVVCPNATATREQVIVAYCCVPTGENISKYLTRFKHCQLQDFYFKNLK